MIPVKLPVTIPGSLSAHLAAGVPVRLPVALPVFLFGVLKAVLPVMRSRLFTKAEKASSWWPCGCAKAKTHLKKAHLRKAHPTKTTAIWAVTACLVMLTPVTGNDVVPRETTESDVLASITTMAEETVELPCDLSSRGVSEAVRIVFWYKGESPAPFYSYDLRTSGGGQHWSDETVLGRRARFEVGLNPPSLRVSDVRADDEQTYQCRVDYDGGPSKTSTVKLAVIVPPTIPVVTDESGDRVKGAAGPYLEGGSAILTCKTLGGRPSPSLMWLRDGHVWEDSFKMDHRGQVRNLLHLDNLGRDVVDSVFTCRASNNNLTKPLDTTLSINMTLAPLTINLLKVVGAQDFVSAGVTEELECSTTGSRPPAQISWWRDGSHIDNPNTKVMELVNKTVSILRLSPKPGDHGVVLTCRVENPALPSSTLEESYKLNVHYVPKVELSPGMNLNPKSIREGTDVYFECRIVANPKFYKITWTHNGEPITHNVADGVLVANQSLVLQRVGRERAGPYACRATNLQGEGISNSIELAIRYAPVCAPIQQLEYQVARHDTANITCQVDAVPDNVTFTWRFNTSGSLLELGEGRASSKGLTSVLPYTPASPGDYGLLLCSASNAIGSQLDPCVINVTAAKPPELLEGCNIRNQTSHSVLVTCTGVDTVFLSTFSMEVLTSDDLALVTKVSNTTPFFEATGLQPGTAYTLRVGVTSPMGDSEPIVLKAFTVKTAEKRMGISEPEEEEALGLSPIVGVMVGAILALVLITAATIAAALRFCPARRRQQRGAQLAGVDFMEVSTPKDAPAVAPLGTAQPPVVTTSTTLPQIRPDDRNPDLIPLKDECDYQLEELRVPPCQVGPPGQCRHTEVATLTRGSGMMGATQWEAADPCMHHHHHHHHPYHSLPPASTIGSFLPPSSTCEMMTSGVFSSRVTLAGAGGGGGAGGDVSCATSGGPMTVAGAESLVGGMVVVTSCPAAYTTPVPTAAGAPAPAYPCGSYPGGGADGGSGVQSPLQYAGGGGSSNTSGSATVGSTSPLLSQYPPPPEEYDGDTYRQESSV